ncbi:MAG: sensor histidine kinase [Cyclobacteriaceae bacterium]
MKVAVALFLLILLTFTCHSQVSVIDSLQNIVALHRHDSTELNALLHLTNEFSRKDITKAKKFSLQVVAQADPLSEVKWLTSAYNYLITMSQQAGQIDSARYFLVTAEKLVQENSTNVRIKFNYNQAAGLFYKNLGEYTKALPYVLDNIKIWKKEDENRAGQLLNLGNLYFSMGDYKNATASHLQSLKLFETLKNLRGQSFCFQSLGNDFFSLNQYAKSEKYYERSLALKEQLGDKRGVLTTTISLGDVYKEKKQFSRAEEYYLLGLKGSRQMKLILEEARCQNQLGLLYKQIGERSKSENALNEGLTLARKGGDSSMSATINSELIGLAVETKKEKMTESTLLSNLSTHIKSGDRNSEATEYSHLVEYYAANKEFDKAFEYLKKHEQLKDSVEGSTVVLQLKELEEKYQNEKHEQEIQLLRKDQELQSLALSRERTNVVLIAFALLSVLIISVLLVNRYRLKNRANRMIEMERIRNSIARDLHDDIGSTLSSINIMSQLALNENSNTDQQLKKIATHSAQMMENMSDIVWSINPKNDLAEQMVFKMKEFCAEILEPAGINYSFHVDNSIETLKLDSEKRKNLFLIFKEAINNAAKYSCSTEVTIKLSVHAGHLHFVVDDNGKGFNKGEIRTGNGLSNMNARASAISGSLQFDTEPGMGTQITLTIPIT